MTLRSRHHTGLRSRPYLRCCAWSRDAWRATIRTISVRLFIDTVIDWRYHRAPDTRRGLSWSTRQQQGRRGVAAQEPVALGELLKRYRIAAGLTQEEFAERAGVSARSISDLERGLQRTPYPSTLRRLAQALQLGAEGLATPASFLGGSASLCSPPSRWCTSSSLAIRCPRSIGTDQVIEGHGVVVVVLGWRYWCGSLALAHVWIARHLPCIR
jgi:transcriptional regulator with XRE-family HTH domain